MIRRPLRPLARILKARDSGENPDVIEHENRRQRIEEARDRQRARAEGRLLIMGLFFVLGFSAIGVRMGFLAAAEPQEPTAEVSGAPIINQRADIVDRNGRLLATNFDTHALYAQPPQMIDPARAARELVRIFPELDHDRLLRDFTGERRFLWIRRQISPEQMQAVHDIGDPGLMFGPREMRIYPNGSVAAHILGGFSYGREGVSSAEVIGIAGVERFFDERLRDPANEGEPLQLSIDLTIQATMEEVLDGGVKVMNAAGAAGIIMDAFTGEIVAMASLPDFDPNSRPTPALDGDPSHSPLFNRTVQGVYELGSVFKIFAAAQALELGLVNPQTIIDTRGPLRFGRFTVRDFSNYGPQNSVRDVMAVSSNIGTARIAGMIGPERQRRFMDQLGMLRATGVELSEANSGAPLFPAGPWSEISMLTISYGHGISVSPLHLAAGYAAMVNGGTMVRPTLLHTEEHQQGERVITPQVSAQVRDMLRAVVTEGTASFANIAEYAIGGKTGTAEKPRPQGGYYDDINITTFAGFFPVEDPRYVMVVSLDEAVETSGSEDRRTAGWTTVPVAAELVRRVAPLLGLRPQVELARLNGVTPDPN